MSRIALKEGLFELSGDGHLLGGRCSECERFNFPAQSLCPYCSGDTCAVVPLSRQGVVEVCTTVINRPPAYEGSVPFGFGVVELPEGIRIISRITDPERARAGTAVRLCFETLCTDGEGREIVTYAFETIDA